MSLKKCVLWRAVFELYLRSLLQFWGAFGSAPVAFSNRPGAEKKSLESVKEREKRRKCAKAV